MTAIEEYPGYYATRAGNIYSRLSGKLRKLKPSPGRGTISITFRKEGKLINKPVRRIIAKLFLDQYQDNRNITVIDGDIYNNHVNNLRVGRKPKRNMTAYSKRIDKTNLGYSYPFKNRRIFYKTLFECKTMYAISLKSEGKENDLFPMEVKMPDPMRFLNTDLVKNAGKVDELMELFDEHNLL